MFTDILVRRVCRLRLELMLRAFADDFAVVAPNLRGCIPTLMKQCEEVARVAGLGLNLTKCVLVPLWPVDLELVRVEFARRFPGWASISVRDRDTYLGFVVGPGSGDCSWEKPLRKYADCARW